MEQAVDACIRYIATGEPCGLCYRYAIDHGIDPFTHYLNLQLSGHALARPGIVTTGQTS